MKHYKSVNKLYNDIVIKDEVDNRPYFIMQHEDGYLIFKSRDEILHKAYNFKSAEIYVRTIDINAIIIIIDFKQKTGNS